MSLDITVTDQYCGAGGSSTGAQAAGAIIELAINHWKVAIETHNTNHPNTTHVLTDLQGAGGNPRRYNRTTMLISSPECTNHTLAKGQKRKNQRQLELFGTAQSNLKKEEEERSRCTMWTPLEWAECHGYQAVIMENVVDINFWGPFEGWKKAWDGLDYNLQFVYLNSMHTHPTPQSRDRVYIVATKKGNPLPDLNITPKAYCERCEKDVASVQCWKNPMKRYGKYKKQYEYCCPECSTIVTPYYYAAANAIDWSKPAPRIGDRKKPLEEKTMQRIADGIERFMQPFTFTMNHSKAHYTTLLHQAAHTQTTYDSTGIAIPPFILDHLGEYRPRPITRALSTLCASGNHHSIITPPTQEWVMCYQNDRLTTPEEAIPTVTTLARHALLTHEGKADTIAVEDCGFRMLNPSEIGRGMAFPDEYVVTGTRRQQVTQYGNAVTPPTMKELVGRTIATLS